MKLWGVISLFHSSIPHTHIMGIMLTIQCKISFIEHYSRLIVFQGGYKTLYCSITFRGCKKGHSADLPSHHCVFQVKIDFLQQAVGIYKFTATTWAQSEKQEQNAQESAWRGFDNLDFLHKSALFIRLPLTTGVRGACESSLPLSASQDLSLKRILVHRCSQRTHTVYSMCKMVRSLHNLNHLCCEELYENFCNPMMMRQAKAQKCAQALTSDRDSEPFVAPEAANSSDWW